MNTTRAAADGAQSNQLAALKARLAGTKESPGSVYTVDGVQYRDVHDAQGKKIRTETIGEKGGLGAGRWFQSPEGELKFFENSSEVPKGWAPPIDQATAALNASLKNLAVDQKLATWASWIGSPRVTDGQKEDFAQRYNKNSENDMFVKKVSPPTTIGGRTVPFTGGTVTWEKVPKGGGVDTPAPAEVKKVVVMKDGKKFKLPANQLQDAISQGYTEVK